MAYQCLGTPVTAFLALTILTWAAVIVFGTTQELSTTTGDTVNIPCLFGDGTLSSIFWAYNDGTGRHKILSLANWDLNIEPEYASRASLQKDNSTLILKDITVADEGTYRCDVDRQGQTVVTNINTNLNVFSLHPDTLPMISPCIVADESSSCSIHANQTFTLTCTLPNVYPVEVTKLIWYQDGQRVSFTDDVNTQNDDGTTDISTQIQVCGTGNFTCNATYVSANGRENTVRSVEAWIIPLLDVPNTPGKDTTSGDIFWLISVMFVLSLSGLLIITRIRYRLKARGQRSSRHDTNDSDGTQLSQARESPTEEPDIDDILMAIARKIQGDHVNHLGKELGFDKVEIERYVARNSRYMNFTCAGTLAMLRDWDKKRFKARERAALKKALMDIGLVHLADNFLSEEGSVEYSTEYSNVRNRFVNRIVSEKEFLNLSMLIAPSYYNEVGFNLDISIEELGQIKEVSQNTTDALMTVFIRWRDKQSPGTDIRSVLAKELERSDLVSLSGKLLDGRLVPMQTDLLPPTENFDDMLVALAKKLRRASDIDTLGRKLGFTPEDIHGCIATNHQTKNITYDGTLRMLRDWRQAQKNSTERGALKTALEQSGQIRLADDLFPSVECSTLPESFTGRNRYMNSEITDEMLYNLARQVPSGRFVILSHSLGIGYNEARLVLLNCQMDHARATMECFVKWRNELNPSETDLHEVLRAANLEGLIEWIDRSM